MNKDDFIVRFNNLINDISIENTEFEEIISLLKVKGSIDSDFEIDENKSQKENILLAVYKSMLNFYKIYLGQ
jgi:hypothetical protein